MTSHQYRHLLPVPTSDRDLSRYLAAVSFALNEVAAYEEQHLSLVSASRLHRLADDLALAAERLDSEVAALE